jgi:hypothetical protein
MTNGKLALPGLARNPVSVAGAAVVTLAAALFLWFFMMDLFGVHANPYLGIVFFLMVPGIFVFGLVLIPIGMLLERRRQKKGISPVTWPRLDLNLPSHRRTVIAVAALTLVNMVIVSLAAYRGVEYMD